MVAPPPGIRPRLHPGADNADTIGRPPRSKKVGFDELQATLGGMQPDDSNREADSRLPSGRWTGWWEQGTRRARMELFLTFENGRLFGDGRDAVGDFTFGGNYDLMAATADMLKTYLGGHDVDYQGRVAEKGIRGIWCILFKGVLADGGPFHIWPAGAGEGGEMAAQTQEELPKTVNVP